jgi:choline-sulfatase
LKVLWRVEFFQQLQTGSTPQAAMEFCSMSKRPNILFLMTDQQRFDSIAALGNSDIYTPNLDRLVARGVSFSNAYSPCPVCVPARYTIRTGCESTRTGLYSNGAPQISSGQPAEMEERCGPYLARVMNERGYRTFGIGKFHTAPAFEDLGYEVQLNTEELWNTPQERARDAFAAWLSREHPEYSHIEQLHGERTEMYFHPQTGALPAELTVESFVADRAIEQLHAEDARPFFGFVSFIGPHPPLAPPIPFNRLYDPDKMPPPMRGEIEIDHRDPFIAAHLHTMFADDLSDFTWQCCKARYYGEITYIDDCIGRILDALEKRGDADNTLICFFSDHGEMLGDHHACQKQNFFEQSCRVPFLLSWPNQLPRNQSCDALVSLADLFGIATSASGETRLRQGIDVLGVLRNDAAQREYLFGCCGNPGTRTLRVMVRWRDWKYIFIANGGAELLFNLRDDPSEKHQRLEGEPDIARNLRQAAADYLKSKGVLPALENGGLKTFAFEAPQPKRCYQFAEDLGVTRFPNHPAAALKKAASPLS